MSMLNFVNYIAQTADGCHTKSFFGLKPWYQYLKLSDDCKDVVGFHFFPDGGMPSSVPLVLVAVVDDLLRIAGLVAFGFLIVGAVGFITSQGNPEDSAKAQSTVINALIGLAVAIVSVAFVSYVGSKLGS